jgi:zinc protease
LGDILMNASFATSEVKMEKEQILSGLRSLKNDPQSIAGSEFYKIVYRGHPFQRPLQGYERTVKNITRSDLIAFYQRYYVPNNVVLAVAGDVDTPSLLRAIKERFNSWPRKQIEFPAVPPISRQARTEKKIVFVDRQQAQILLGHLGIKRNDPDYYALKVLDVILGGGGMSARIPYDLRDVKGLAYTAYSDISSSAGEEPGHFLAYLAVSPANVDKAVGGLLDEINKIRNEPVSDAEISSAKSYLTGSYYLGLQGNSAIADYILFCYLYNYGFDYVRKYPDYINRVTKKDVQQAAQKYLHPEAYTLVIVGPVKKTR